MRLILILEIIGTIAFAMSGALMGIHKELDYYGIVFFGIITAVGGGIIRDIIINRLPYSLVNPTYIIISIVSSILVITFYNKILSLRKFLQYLDAIGLGAFTAIGAGIAIDNKLYQPFIIITLAMLTGTGGGILRDVFAQEIPFAFRKEIYAIASIVGSIVFIIMNNLFESEIALYITFIVTTSIRIFCMRKNINLKRVVVESK